MILKEYETICVLKPELPEDALTALSEKITGIVERFEGTMLDIDVWGKRKLAYPIRNHTRGHYVLYSYAGPSGVVAEIERNLNIDDNLLRFLTVRVADDVDVERRKAEAAAAREAREAARAAAQTTTDDSSTSSESGEGTATQTEMTDGGA